MDDKNVLIVENAQVVKLRLAVALTVFVFVCAAFAGMQVLAHDCEWQGSLSEWPLLTLVVAGSVGLCGGRVLYRFRQWRNFWFCCCAFLCVPAALILGYTLFGSKVDMVCMALLLSCSSAFLVLAYRQGSFTLTTEGTPIVGMLRQSLTAGFLLAVATGLLLSLHDNLSALNLILLVSCLALSVCSIVLDGERFIRWK